MSFPPQLLTSTQHYACLLNYSLFRVNYMKKDFDRSLLYEDPVSSAGSTPRRNDSQNRVGASKGSPLFKLFGKIWLSHSNLSATW